MGYYLLFFVLHAAICYVISEFILDKLIKAKKLKNTNAFGVAFFLSPLFALLYYGLLPDGTDCKNESELEK